MPRISVCPPISVGDEVCYSWNRDDTSGIRLRVLCTNPHQCTKKPKHFLCVVIGADGQDGRQKHILREDLKRVTVPISTPKADTVFKPAVSNADIRSFLCGQKRPASSPPGTSGGEEGRATTSEQRGQSDGSLVLRP